MSNAYCDLATLKSAGALNISGGGYDGRLLALVEQASRLIDGYCNRHFYVRQETRRFEGNRWAAGLQQILVPDLAGVESVRVAAGGGLDGPGAAPGDKATWRAASYRLYPPDAAPAQPWGRPYTRIAVAPEYGPGGRREDGYCLVEITGRWGYREVAADTGVTIGAGPGVGPADTGLTVSDGGALSAGQTLSIGTEQLYVAAATGAELTVARGVNGTAAAAHQAGAAIGVYRYPGPVVEACLQLATELWQGRNRVGTDREGRQSGRGASGLGKEVEGLLGAYRKLAI